MFIIKVLIYVKFFVKHLKNNYGVLGFPRTVVGDHWHSYTKNQSLVKLLKSFLAVLEIRFANGLMLC